ncbi:MAG: phosphoribosylformylglycinamidine cyclo-ligase [Bacteroidetes bacterium]|nr:phosphoribosylformylglycinamidine cyclo-ligase [Bacteroidota bacterium]
MSRYAKRGVSAQKEDVHAAIKRLSPGLYPYSFCKVYPDYLNNDNEWVSIMHADGAGTKSILAYLYWCETGDLSVWKGVAQDAIVMNLDDLLCVGVTSSLLFSSTIDRNKKLIPGEVLAAIIDGTSSFFDQMSQHGVAIQFMGGETADVGDVVRTIAINGTMAARWPKSHLVTNEKIQPGNVIVGLASFGQASYESAYNSGIASNGLTSARHDLLNDSYRTNYPESLDPAMELDVAYSGPYKLSSEIVDQENRYTIGQLLLSPTRTFAPVIKELLAQMPTAVNGLIHCSGGGQTKCLKYLPGNFKVIKDNLFIPPVIFKLIQQASNADLREMMQVFNMGTRLEIYTDPHQAQAIIDIAASFGVAAQIIGRVEAGVKKELHIQHQNQSLVF